MDIWATWCGSCRVEMTPAREIHKLFHNKDVVFVNICMKSTQEAWAKMICHLKLLQVFFQVDIPLYGTKLELLTNNKTTKCGYF